MHLFVTLDTKVKWAYCIYMKKKTRPIRPQRFDIVQVEWLDTEQNYDWIEFQKFDSSTPPTIMTVGFLYEDSRSKVVVFQSIDSSILIGGTGTFDSILTIPRCSVKSIKIIKRFSKK